MKPRNILPLVVFDIMAWAVAIPDAHGQIIVDQPCNFVFGYDDVNANRRHWDDENGFAVDFGADERRPVDANGRAIVHQACHGNVALASIGGTVTAVRENGAFACAALNGRVVQNTEILIEREDGVRASYLHMDIWAANTVHLGQRVSAGDVIGTIGSVGCSTFPHIHFRVYRGGVLQRYANWRFGPVPVEPEPLPEAEPRNSYFELKALDIRTPGGAEACIDVHNANYREGTRLQLYACNQNAAQKFVHKDKRGSIELVENRNLPQEFCIDVPNANFVRGQPVQIWTCNDTKAQQFGYDRRFNQIRLRERPNLCLTIGQPDGDFTPIVLDTCRGGLAEQKFLLSELVQVRSALRNAHDQELCLDVERAEYVPHTPVQLFHCKVNETAQKFVYEHWTGVFRLWDAPHMCLDVPDGIFRDGNQMQIFNCSGHIAQKFFYYEASRSHDYTIRPWGNPNYCLDVQNASTEDGTRVQMWWCNESNAEKWFMENPR